MEGKHMPLIVINDAIFTSEKEAEEYRQHLEAQERKSQLGAAALAAVTSLAENFQPDPAIMNLGNEARCPECGAIRPLGTSCPTGNSHSRG